MTSRLQTSRTLDDWQAANSSISPWARRLLSGDAFSKDEQTRWDNTELCISGREIVPDLALQSIQDHGKTCKDFEQVFFAQSFCIVVLLGVLPLHVIWTLSSKKVWHLSGWEQKAFLWSDCESAGPCIVKLHLYRMHRRHRVLQKKWILSTQRASPWPKDSKGADGINVQIQTCSHQAFGWHWEILNERERKAPRRHTNVCFMKNLEGFSGKQLNFKVSNMLEEWGWSQWNCGSPYVCGQPLDANKHVWCLELEVCLLEVHVIKSSSKRTRLLRQVSESWPVWNGSSEVEFALGSWDAACTPAYYTAIRLHSARPCSQHSQASVLAIKTHTSKTVYLSVCIIMIWNVI